MTDWNPLHRDAKWLERVPIRAEMNSREIDRLNLWIAWLSVLLGMTSGAVIGLRLSSKPRAESRTGR